MAANKKPNTYNEDFEQALKYLEDEARRLTLLSKNLSETWKKGDREWVPMYLYGQTIDIEEKMKQIRSLIKRVPRENIEDAPKATVPGACQEREDKIKQLEKNNEILLQNKKALEIVLRDLKKEPKKEEVPPVIQSSLQVDKQEEKPVSTFKLSNGEEVLNSPQIVFLKKMVDLESEFENEKADLKSENGKLLEKIDTLETRIQELEKDNNVLSERLSKNPGNMLVENNPATIDLSDPNRPTKLAEYFSELYDNEWTDAFEALKTAGYDEITAINTLRLTLENVLHFCEIKAELLLIKASDAVNLLFKEYQQSILDMALIMGKHLRPEQSSLDDIKLQHMWNPKTEKGSQKSRSENMNEIEIIKVEAENELKTLRKKTASAMVPIVQKAYIESYCSDECIDEIKPFILKCLYLGWMMKVQSPPMVFHKCDMEARFDKNLYKEYLTSGQLVNFVVLPALLLHENGPVVCKGVAEGKKIQT